MTPERFFCALQSRKNREAIFATVARIDSWILLEYPMAWRRNAVEQSRIPEILKHKLADLRRNHPLQRQVLVRQCHRPRESVKCILVRSAEVHPEMREVAFATYDEMADGDLHSFSAIGHPLTEPIYAVCTHGTHDKCCAKFGLATYRAALRSAGDRVWQCSHIGGDRFAANVVVFPYGIYYGRVDADDVTEIIESTDRGEILLKHYRGRCCYARVVQAAEYFVRRESGVLAIDGLMYSGRARQDTDRWMVSFRNAANDRVHKAEVRIVRDALVERLTCGSDVPSGVAQYELIRYTS